jgi:hypothetical protein
MEGKWKVAWAGLDSRASFSLWKREEWKRKIPEEVPASIKHYNISADLFDFLVIETFTFDRPRPRPVACADDDCFGVM